MRFDPQTGYQGRKRSFCLRAPLPTVGGAHSRSQNFSFGYLNDVKVAVTTCGGKGF